MRSLSRNMVALAFAAVSIVAPAGAQEVRRPVPHAGMPHGTGAPHAAGPRGGPASRAFGAASSPIQAQQPRRGGNGAGVAAGVIGGLAAGAILGGILSNNGAAAAPGPEVGPGGCPLVRRPVYDGAGQFAGYQAVPSC